MPWSEVVGRVTKGLDQELPGTVGIGGNDPDAELGRFVPKRLLVAWRLAKHEATRRVRSEERDAGEPSAPLPPGHQQDSGDCHRRAPPADHEGVGVLNDAWRGRLQKLDGDAVQLVSWDRQVNWEVGEPVGEVEVKDRSKTCVLAPAYLYAVRSDNHRHTGTCEADPRYDLPVKAEPSRRVSLVHHITPSAASVTCAHRLKSRDASTSESNVDSNCAMVKSAGTAASVPLRGILYS